jgi:carbon monoxide dehydrogenase subunit G
MKPFFSTVWSTIWVTVFLIGLTLPMSASAHGPSRVKQTEIIIVDAPPEKVWELIGDFGGIHRWHPDVEKTESTGGNEPKATRVIMLKNGGVIHELLTKYDAGAMTYQYRITEVDVKVLPVKNYSSKVILTPTEDGGTQVTWQGAFYRGYMGNDPPPELNEDAAQAAVSKVYTVGLKNLKKLAEAGN